MQLLRQSTAATVLVGPVLDSAGLAITTAVIGDFQLTKNGTTTALASPATATHSHNGNYLIALSTGNTDTAGRLVVTVNNSAQAMGTHRYTVLLPSVFDAIVTNATNTTGGLPTATGTISALAGAVSTLTAGGVRTELATELGRIDATIGSRATPTNITSATGVTLAPTTGLGNQTANLTGNLSGSVGSVTGSVGSVASFGTLVSDIATAVWNAGTRTLTAFGFNVNLTPGTGLGAQNGSVASVGLVEELDENALTANDATDSITAAVWDAPYSQHKTAGTFGKLMDILRKANTVVEGTVTNAVTPTTTSFSSNVNYPTGAFKHAVLMFEDSSAINEQNSPILTYVNTNGVFTVEEPFTVAPTVGDKFIIVPTNHVHSIAAIQNGLATSTALAAVATNVTALVTRIPATLFAGITSLANWLGAIAGKTADSTTRSQINATAAGASFNETTDSLEAIRDRGDAAWVSGGGAGGVTNLTIEDRSITLE
jgi:hypothetical protein